MSNLPSPPKVRIVDAYNATIDDFIRFVVPPDPAEPMSGERAVFRLQVPAKNTSFELGDGKLAGIRMETDDHVHLTARNPLTTISLGTPGGAGTTDAAPGLRICTDGVMEETVLGDVSCDYQKSKTEYVGGKVSELYHGAKSEMVRGRLKQTYWDEHSMIVFKNANHEFGANKSESINGNWDISVTGVKNEYVAGKSCINEAKSFEFTYGAAFDLFAGRKGAALLGLNESFNLAGQFSFSAGVNVGVNVGINYSASNISVSKVAYAYGKPDVTWNEGELDINKVKSVMVDSILTIFK